MSAPDPTAGETAVTREPDGSVHTDAHEYVSTSRDHHFCDVCHLAEDDDRARHRPATPDADDASEPLTEDEREAGGRLVREVWVEWAREQPNPKPSWLVPWEGLSEPDREVDRRIAERVKAAAATKARAEETEAALEDAAKIAEACSTGTQAAYAIRLAAHIARGDA